MKKIFFVFLCFFIKVTYSQNITKPTWKNDNYVFSSVELKVLDLPTKKIIFNGYKDATITLTNINSIVTNSISLQLNGYFNLEDGIIQETDYKSDMFSTNISYIIKNDSKMASVSFNFNEHDELDFIIIVGANEINKNAKKLSFKLSGFAKTY